MGMAPVTVVDAKARLSGAPWPTVHPSPAANSLPLVLGVSRLPAWPWLPGAA